MTALGGTTAEAAPIDLTPCSARFISRAVADLGDLADRLRNAPSFTPAPALLAALEASGVHYDPDGPAFWCQDATARVSITLRDGAAVLSVTGARA